MPNTPERGNEQPGSPEQRRRQQLNDKSLAETDDDSTEEEDVIAAPSIDDDDDTDDDAEVTPLRTEQGGESGEDEDLPDDATTQVNSNPGREGGRR